MLNEIFNTIKDFIYIIDKDGTYGELNIIGRLIKIGILFLLIRIIRKILLNMVDRTVISSSKVYKTIDQEKEDLDKDSENRVFTIVNVIKKIISAFLYFIWAMMALSTFNVDTKGLIAGAGIGGLAIGFGAQSLVKDIITGFFILFENQFSVGDHVELEGYQGIVEDLGLRVTKIRAFSGELYIIPNGNVTIVTNMSRGPMRASILVSIAYEEDIDNAIKVLENMCDNMGSIGGRLLEKPKVIGVSDLGAQSVDITIHAKSKPMEQFYVERYIRKKSKETLVENGIEIPYPRNVLIEWKEN